MKYPCIDLAYAAGRAGGSMTAAMNAANERANEIFRQEKISVMRLVCLVVDIAGFGRACPMRALRRRLVRDRAVPRSFWPK